MAKIIDDMRKKVGRNCLYPWDEWLDGRARELNRPDDFTSTVKSFRRMAYLKASLSGMRLQVKLIGDDTIHMQASPIEEPKP